MLKCEADLKEEWKQTVEDFGEFCNCSWPCDDVTYPGSASSIVWPSQNSLQSFLFSVIIKTTKNTKAYQHYETLKSSNASQQEQYSWVQRHFLKLNVFPKSNVVSVTTEVPKYTITDLLCNIGGCLGLWVGMSVITLVETIDLVIKVFHDIFTLQKKSIGSA